MTNTDGLGTAETLSKEAPKFEGVVLDRTDPEFLAKAFDVYAELRAKGPVVRADYHDFSGDNAEQYQEGKRTIKEVFFVSHYDEAAAALLDDRISSDPYVLLTPEQRAMKQMPGIFRPLVHSLILMDPPDHTRLRRLVQPSFNAKAMDALKPRIQRIADELLDKAEQEAAARGETTPERTMELIKAFAYPLPVTVISDMLGIPEEDRAMAQHLVELRIDSRDAESMKQRFVMLSEFTNYLVTLFERKRREPGDDMISQMIHAQEEGDKLSNEELLSMVFLLYLAGHVTTVNLIGNGVAALLTHPEQLALFKSDPALAKGVVEETLRYWGPIDFLSGATGRVAKENVELGGVEVAKGAQLAVALGAANRDPKQFVNPEKYDISRADANRHIAFGKGIHLCLGAPLARIEGQIAFETLFRRLPELRLAIPQEDLRWRAGLRGFRELPVLF